MERILCGVDLGGTKIKTGLVYEGGRVINSLKVPTDANDGPEAVIGRIIKSIEDTIRTSGVKISIIDGIGIGVPGQIDIQKGTVVNLTNLPGWGNIPLKDTINKYFNIPVKIENDGNCAAFAEYIAGAGKCADVFLYMTVSTGIGGGVVINGEIFHGANCGAVEIGHMSIDLDGPKCGCGSYGCFEAMASGTAIARFAKEGAASIETVLNEIKGEINAMHVFDAAREGDKFSISLLDREAFYLGVGISNMIALYNPRVIAIGGGVSNGLDMLYEKMMDTVCKRSLKASYDVCTIVKAKLGDDTGLIGAASIMF